jgi:hypothetical protein
MSGCHRHFKLECTESLLVLYGRLIHWQVIVLKDLSLPLVKVLQKNTNSIMYIKARSGKARLSWYCEDGTEHSYLLFYLK